MHTHTLLIHTHTCTHPSYAHVHTMFTHTCTHRPHNAPCLHTHTHPVYTHTCTLYHITLTPCLYTRCTPHPSAAIAFSQHPPTSPRSCPQEGAAHIHSPQRMRSFTAPTQPPCLTTLRGPWLPSCPAPSPTVSAAVSRQVGTHPLCPMGGSRPCAEPPSEMGSPASSCPFLTGRHTPSGSAHGENQSVSWQI